MPGYTIARADTDDLRRVAARLRHAVLVGECGYRIPGADPDAGVVEEGDAHAAIFLAFDGEEPVGTITVAPWADCPMDEETRAALGLDRFADAFGRASVAVTKKLLVRASHRGRGVIMQLVGDAFASVVTPRLQFMFLDCSPFLVRWYERFGYRRCGPHFYYGDTGVLSVPMVLALGDHAHLARARAAPVLALLERLGHPDDPAVRTFLAENAIAAEDAAPRMRLLEGMDESEKARLLSVATEHAFGPRERLLDLGGTRGALLMLVDGFVEVSQERAGERVTLATCGPGDVLGEVGNLLGRGHSADVIAVTAGRLVALEDERLAAVLASDTSLAARYYHNLAVGLAERLRVLSQWVSESPPL